jgi:uncharacterized protein (TIGR00369 family)
VYKPLSKNVPQNFKANKLTAPVRSPKEEAKTQAAIIDVFERQITFNQTLGFTVIEFSNTPKVRFDMRDELVGHFLYGRLHGGVTSAVLDATGGFALMCALAFKHPDESSDQVLHRFSKLGTIDMRIDYLRPGLGKHFIASAVVNRLGGRIGSTQMALHNDSGELIATGAAAYIVS